MASLRAALDASSRDRDGWQKATNGAYVAALNPVTGDYTLGVDGALIFRGTFDGLVESLALHEVTTSWGWNYTRRESDWTAYLPTGEGTITEIFPLVPASESTVSIRAQFWLGELTHVNVFSDSYAGGLLHSEKSTLAAARWATEHGYDISRIY